MSMIVSEPMRPPSLREGGGSDFGQDPGRYRTWEFSNFVFNSGMGLLDFSGFGFAGHYDQG